MALNDSAELLDLIRLRGSIPSNSPDWTAAKILRQASLELIETHLPMLLAARGEYLVKSEDIDLVPGQLGYRLPARCSTVRYVGFLQSDGGQREIPEAKPGELVAMAANIRQTAAPTRYTFREHNIEVWPLPAGSVDKLRVKWHIRPNRIVETTNATVISSIIPNGSETTISWTTPPTGPIWTAGFGGPWDFVKATSPFDIPSFDVAEVDPSPPSNSIVVATAALDSSIVVGDYLVPARYTTFPNVPEELHEPVALRAAAAIISAKGDGLAERLREEATAKEKQLLVGVLAPRSKGNAQVIMSRRWR